MSERLNKLYEAMETLQKEGLSLSSAQEKQLNALEEDIIKKEVFPIVRENIEPALEQVKRELVLVVDYVPGTPISVHLSRKRKFIEEIKDAVAITQDPEVPHKEGKQKETMGTKSPITRLKIIFADGHTIHEAKATETFVKFVKEVGVERVRSLGLKQCKVPLVSNTIDKKYGKSQKPLGDGWYLITHSSTKDKIRDIKKIAKAFKIKLKKVEAVDNYAESREGAKLI